MKDFILLLLERPLVGLMTGMLTSLLYLFMVVGAMEVAVAGLTVRSEDWTETRQLMLEMNETLIRMDQTLIDLNKENK